jgi:hypothetical protein
VRIRIRPTQAWGSSRSDGQSLVELALVLPVLVAILAGAVQLGVAFSARNVLIQIARDTARWAATQQVSPCASAATATPPQPVTEADALATSSGLLGYVPGAWPSGSFTAYDNTSLPANAPADEAVEVLWEYPAIPPACPPLDNTTFARVTVRLTHRVPIFLPGLGTCDGSGCYVAMSATATFRMEPPLQ